MRTSVITAHPRHTRFNRGGRGVLLGACMYGGANSFGFTAMTPAQQVASAVEFSAVIDPQYKSQFENGVAVARHSLPFTLGCAGEWTEAEPARSSAEWRRTAV
ncbi:hypothetical protein [Bradyrhizobium sp. DASA03007]|uniref:hypothetical protein n=1 Tax=unclassified Bradyrhizobium TaxID=2631580 RepID=UPI003F7213A5